ncbi:MAG TPA: ABC transporter permease [Candidatus Angelobacter sp.]
MKYLRSFFLRLFGILRHSDQDINTEIEANLQLHIDDKVRAGMSASEARRDAIMKLGGIGPAKEAWRERRTLPLLENLIQDTRFALRQLRKSPGFAATAMVMLATGICASVAIFAFVDAALLKPLPYQSPARLMGVYESASRCERCNLSYQDYLDWKRLNTVFTSLDIYNHNGATIPTASGPRMTPIGRVSAGFFSTLGVKPFLGRDFSAGEDAVGAPRVALLSYGAWQANYGGRRDVVGQNVILDDTPTTIVGVLPPDFHFVPSEPAEFWIPLQPTSNCEKRRSCHNLYGVARLKDGASVATAQSNTELVARQLEQQYPDSNRGQGARIVALSEVISGDIRPLLLILLSGAGLLLLIACVNVSSLVLVRTEGRRREVAVRSALGASPARLSRQFATEGLLLVVAGGGAGLAASYWAMQLFTKLIPARMLASMPFLLGLKLNPRVLAFAAAISCLATILFALTPRARLSKAGMRGDLAEGSRSVAGSSWRRVGSKLVIVELATAMVLLVGAGLLGQSLYRLLRVELGFHPDHLATLSVGASGKRYDTEAKSLDWARRTLSRIASLPGVKSVGTSSVMAVSYNGNTRWIRFVGKPYNGEHNDVNFRDVSPGYFETLQAKLLRGRFFADADDLTKPNVVIVNRALAELYFQGEDPLGKQIGDTELSPKSLKQIVGVVDNIREGALDSVIRPAMYLPFNQEPEAEFDLVVRTAQSPQAILPSLSRVIHEVDPDVATVRPITMEDRIHDSPAAYMHRSAAWLVSGFAALALVLAVVGLYGVIAYSVSQRTREVGVRMALGAQRSSVYRMVLQEAGVLSAIGIFSGVVCSLVSATLIQKLLFETPPRDVPTLAVVAVVLGAASLLASYVPARQAASVNPVEALRAE